jgi:hypothetical protein
MEKLRHPSLLRLPDFCVSILKYQEKPKMNPSEILREGSFAQ